MADDDVDPQQQQPAPQSPGVADNLGDIATNAVWHAINPFASAWDLGEKYGPKVLDAAEKIPAAIHQYGLQQVEHDPFSNDPLASGGYDVMPPPSVGAAAAEAAAKVGVGMAKGMYDWATMPGEVQDKTKAINQKIKDQGYITEQDQADLDAINSAATSWAPGTAFQMVFGGIHAPEEGAAGVAGGKLTQPENVIGRGVVDDPKYSTPAMESVHAIADTPKEEAVQVMADNEDKGLSFPLNESAVRLRTKLQREQRAEQKGQELPGTPKNDRTVVRAPQAAPGEPQLPDFVTGKITPQDWVERQEKMMSPEEIDQASNWYKDIRNHFLEQTNGDATKADRYMRAWLVAQQNVDVSGAMNNVLLQSEQMARGVPPNKMIKSGMPMPTEAARSVLAGKPISMGVGDKIADFVNSAEGKPVRSYMANHPDGGAPFVVDVHTARDTGLVDPILKNHLTRLGYNKKDIAKLDTDFGGGGVASAMYENRANFGRQLTDYLNDNNWQGRNDWTPPEAQAVGWMGMTKLTAGTNEDVTTAFNRNTRNLSMEAAPGAGSPWDAKFSDRFGKLPIDQQYAVTHQMTQAAIEHASRLAGIDVRDVVHGTGGWENSQSPSTVAQTFSSPSGAEIAANALGHLLNQTEVWSNKVKPLTANPRGFAVDFVARGDHRLNTDAGLREFWQAVMDADPQKGTKTPLFVGYQPIRTRDGSVGVRAMIDRGGAGTKKNIESALAGPVSEALKSVPGDFTPHLQEAEITKARNDWKDNPNGQAYASRLRQLLGRNPAADLRAAGTQLDAKFEAALRQAEARSAGANRGTGVREAQGAPAVPLQAAAKPVTLGSGAADEEGAALRQSLAAANGRHDPSGSVTLGSGVTDKRTSPLNLPIWWHGSASGDLRGGKSGLHLGTKRAATQALEARIGTPADGLGWTGETEYGKRLLAGTDTLDEMGPYNITGIRAGSSTFDYPKHDHYAGDYFSQHPEAHPRYPDGTLMPLDVKPSVEPYYITGSMNNHPGTAYDDFKANGYMTGALKRGNAKNGYYYKNVGEDAGSVSAVVPNGDHVKAAPGHSIYKTDTLGSGAAGDDKASQAASILYHGTSKDRDFGKFKPSRNGTWLTTDPKEASAYAANNDSQNFRYDPGAGRMMRTNTAARVIPVTHSFENTLNLKELPDALKNATNYKKAQGDYFDKLRAQGYDSVKIPSEGGHSIYVALDPKKLKSAYSGKVLGSGATSESDAPRWFSALENAVNNSKTNSAPGQQWLGMLKNTPGVKPEEMDWTGVEDFLKSQKGNVSKQALQDHINSNKIDLQETTRGDLPAIGFSEAMARHRKGEPVYNIDGKPVTNIYSTGDYFKSPVDAALKPPRYGEWALPGGENYREMLLKLPDKSKQQAMREEADRRGYTGSIANWPDQGFANQYRQVVTNNPDSGTFTHRHWPDDKNVLAHVRFDDRNVGGDKTLHIAEVQSDWHQQGRQSGYYRPDTYYSVKKSGDPYATPYGAYETEQEAREALPSYGEGHEIVPRVMPKDSMTPPDAPFKTTWHELALKRMLRYAAENGYDRLSWDSGATAADRFDLSKHVDSLRWFKHKDGTFDISPEIDGASVYTDRRTSNLSPEELAETVGKNVADKIVGGYGKRNVEDEDYQYESSGTIDTPGLNVGGEGMKGFYDKMLPAAANKLVKKYGTKVEQTTLGKIHDNGPLSGTEAMERMRGHPDWADIPSGEKARSEWFRNLSHKDREQLFAKARDRVTPEPPAIHSIKITPELRKAALSQGFPMFASGGAVGYGSFRPSTNIEDDSGRSFLSKATEKIKDQFGDWGDDIEALVEHPFTPYSQSGQPPMPATTDDPLAIQAGYNSIGRAHGGRIFARNINHNPTEAQKASGNYAKEHIHIHGLPITIENSKGSIRRGVGANGKPWQSELPAAYGYFKKTEGADGDHVDVYVGPHHKAPNVYVIDQINAHTKKFDEHKCFIGFGSERQATNTYVRAFSDGRGHDRIGHVATLTVDQFKRWLKTGDTAKPIATDKELRVEQDKNKVSHLSVGYVSESKYPDRRCDLCMMFTPESLGGPECDLVKDQISKAGWCRRFYRKSFKPAP